MPGKILIYGGAGGIGSAIARELHEKEYALHLVGRDPDRLSSIARELDATFTVGDVEDDATFSRVAEEAGDVLGGLVYAVGTINLRALPRLTEADFSRDFRVNALGAARAVQTALPALKKNTATSSVVLFSSIAAIQGFALHASIGMAKAAVSGLALSLAAELAPKVRVNAIAPSLTRTALADGILANDQIAASIAKLHPIPRLGEPTDIASLAVFLLGTDADWITGQVMSVDGGRSTLRTVG